MSILKQKITFLVNACLCCQLLEQIIQGFGFRNVELLTNLLWNLPWLYNLIFVFLEKLLLSGCRCVFSIKFAFSLCNTCDFIDGTYILNLCYFNYDFWTILVVVHFVLLAKCSHSSIQPTNFLLHILPILHFIHFLDNSIINILLDSFNPLILNILSELL